MATTFIMVNSNHGSALPRNNASLCIEQLRNRRHVESTCPAPTITEHNQVWSLEILESDCQMTFRGGAPTYQSDILQFTELPSTLTIYNRYAMSWQYTLGDTNAYRLVEQSTRPASEKHP